MMCENTRSLPKALLPNWRRSLSVPSSAKTGPQFSFRAQPPSKSGDLSILRSHDHQPGTLGFSDFGIHSRASRSKNREDSSSSSLDSTDSSPVSTVPLGRRITRTTSVGLLPPPTAAAIVADYKAMYAQSLWEDPPEDSGEYISFLARI
jgi:hypothetical protein